MVCYLLGTNAHARISKANEMNYGSEALVPSLRSLTHDEFMETLKVLGFLHRALNKNSEGKKHFQIGLEPL